MHAGWPQIEGGKVQNIRIKQEALERGGAEGQEMKAAVLKPVS
jgi:hypothetical protein